MFKKQEDSSKKLSFFKRISLLLNLATILFYAIFVAIKLVTDSGIYWLNVGLLIATGLYLLFFLATFFIGSKSAQKVGKKTYKTVKRVLILLNAVMTIMLVFTSKDGNAFVTILLSTFTILNLFVQVVLEIVIGKITKRLTHGVQVVKEKVFSIFKRKEERTKEE